MRSVLLLFFSLHLLAVGIESIPREANDPLATLLRTTWQPLTRPYITRTGQWQRWNLFAPDPLGEVVQFHIDVQDGTEWREKEVLSHHTVEWWRHATVLKVVRLLAREGERYAELRLEFLQTYCETLNIPSGTPLRLRIQTSTISDPSVSEEHVGAEVSCA